MKNKEINLNYLKLSRIIDTYSYEVIRGKDSKKHIFKVGQIKPVSINSEELGRFLFFVPNPTSIFLKYTEEKLVFLKLLKKSLILKRKTRKNKKDNLSDYEYSHNEFDNYLLLLISLPIMLVAALESFLNQKIVEKEFF